MSLDDSLALTADLRAPAHARAWLGARVASFPRLFVEDALVVVSELVTNAVRHGRPDIVVGIDHLPDGVRVRVRDEGAGVPLLPGAQPSPDRDCGRGLLLVAAMADGWGVVTHGAGAGKTVWAHLVRR